MPKASLAQAFVGAKGKSWAHFFAAFRMKKRYFPFSPFSGTFIFEHLVAFEDKTFVFSSLFLFTEGFPNFSHLAD